MISDRLLDDGNLCNGSLFCNLAAKKCTPNPSTAITCPTAADTVCKKNACLPKTGACQPTETGATEMVCTAFADGSQHCQRQVSPKPLQVKIGCDDGDPCTDGDVCNQGVCLAGKEACPCKVDSDCAPKDDGNLCNGTQFCDKSSGACKWNPATVVTCPSVDNTQCLKVACHPKSGQCINVEAKEATNVCEDLPNGKANCGRQVKALGEPMPLVFCDDGNPCTKGDACIGGNCSGGAAVCECQVNADCASKDDGDLCNGTWYCDKSGTKPLCKANPAGAVFCGDQPKSPCLFKKCEPKSGVCLLGPHNDGGGCDDGEPCTLADACTQGQCNGTTNPCDDNNICTKDSCAVAKGCVHTLANCDDGNVCTQDVCNPKDGTCQLQPAAMDGKGCDADDNTCTPVDLCAGGVCKAGANVVCKLPAGPCEVAQCVGTKPSFSCAVVAKIDGAPCMEGPGCTIGAACQKGQCQPGTQERFYAKDGGPSGKAAEIAAIAPATSGDVVVAGATWLQVAGKPTQQWWWLARLDPLGKPVWQHELPTPAPNPVARAFAVAATSDGGAVAAGGVGTQTAGLNAQLVRTDAMGTLLWTKDFGKADADEAARAVAVGQSGAPVAVGWRQQSGVAQAWALRLTSAGGYVWDTALTTAGGEARAVHLADDGTLTIAGWQLLGGKAAGRLWSMTADGKLLGTPTVLDAVADLRPEAMVAQAGGGWLVVGTGGTASAARAVWLRVDDSGKTLWWRQAKLLSAAHSVGSVGGELAVIAGMVDSSGGNADAALWAIDGLGNVQWARELDGGGQDRALAVVTATTATDGSLAVGGQRTVDVVQRALLARADLFGHSTCASAGVCLGKSSASCTDAKTCTADDCHPSAGCQNPAIDSFACDPQDGCSLDGACKGGNCQAGAIGRLYERTAATGSSSALAAVTADEVGDTVAIGYDTEGATPRKFRWLSVDPTGQLKSSTVIGQGTTGQVSTHKYPIHVAAAVPRAGGGVIAAVSIGNATGTSWTAQLIGVGVAGGAAWTAAGPISQTQSNQAQALVALADGTVVLLADHAYGFAAARYTAAGVSKWLKLFGDTSGIYERRLQRAAAVKGGALIGAGLNRSLISGPTELAVTRLEADGTLGWTRIHALPLSVGAVLADTASVDVWGSLPTVEGQQPARVRTTLDGKITGVWRFGDPKATVEVAAASVRADGSVLLSGVAYKGFVGHAWLGAISTTGELLWQRSTKLGQQTLTSGTGALLVTGDDDAVLVGSAAVAGVDQPYLLRTDRWGHPSCPALGLCAKVPATGCADNQLCTRSLSEINRL